MAGTQALPVMPSADVHLMPGPGARGLTDPVRQRIAAITGGLGLSPDAAEAFLDAARFTRLELDDPVFFEGEVRGVVFWLVDGRLSFFLERKPLFTLDADDALALRPLETQSPFRFTVKAIAPAQVVMLSQMVLDQILHNEHGLDVPLPEPVATLVVAHESRRFDAPLERVLLSPMLQGLHPLEAQTLIAEMPREEYAVNQVVHLDPISADGRDLLVVESGFVAVQVFAAPGADRVSGGDGGPDATEHASAAPVFCEDLGPGELFGEQNLLGDEGFSVKLTWLTPGALRRVSAATFEQRLKTRFVNPIGAEAAETLLTRGEAQLLDVGRGMAELDVGPDRTLHLPLDWLPKRLRNLDPKRQYILMADSDAEAEFAAFYLTTRGIRARPLVHLDPDVTVPLERPGPPSATALATGPAAAARSGVHVAQTGPQRANAATLAAGNPERATGAAAPMGAPSPPAAAADMATPAEAARLGDALGTMFNQFEDSVRAHVAAAAEADRARLARAFANAVSRIEREAKARVREKVAAMQQQYAVQLADAERRLAREQAALSALEAGIAEEREGLAALRRSFEQKLEAAMGLHQEVLMLRARVAEAGASEVADAPPDALATPSAPDER